MLTYPKHLNFHYRVFMMNIIQLHQTLSDFIRRSIQQRKSAPMHHLERGQDGRNQFWRYLVITLVAFFGGQLVGSIPLIALAVNAQMHGGVVDAEMLTDPARLGVSANTGLVLMLLPFMLSLLILIFMIRKMHGRSLPEVINGTRRIRWGRVVYAAGLWALMQLASFGISYAIEPGNFEFRFNAGTFFPLLLISIVLIPLQTSFEELYFRGYVAQGIGAGTRNRWLAILIPGISFGLMHIMNPEIEAYGLLLTLPQYIIFGLLFGLIATLDDGIECCLGAHAVNNILASTVVTFKSSVFTTDALFEQQRLNPAMDLMWMSIMAVVFLFLLKQRYRWDFAVLNKRVEAAPQASSGTQA
jgi:membrane protease YdiL (CAAX protease family)